VHAVHAVCFWLTNKRAVEPKRNDIDKNRMLVYVRSDKVKKDRITLLSRIALGHLGQYEEVYRTVTWLFEAPVKQQYSASNANQMIRRVQGRRA
jgi:integrase